MKGKNLQPRIHLLRIPSKTVIQTWQRKQKFHRQAKIKRIQHHQTNFTTNVKRTSLSRKHKKRKRPTRNKTKTIRKMVKGPYVSIITPNVNGLSAPTKRHRLARQWKHVRVCTFTYHITLLNPQILCNYFVLLS